MSITGFVSAVSDEFHHKDASRPQSFQSYREVLKRSLQILVGECEVVTQEDLRQGHGDLLETLDTEVAKADVVVHLVGDMAGYPPEPAELRRLHERHPDFLEHEPELAAAIGKGTGITYTQWEAYLAFQHDRGLLVFIVDPQAPRSPRFRRDQLQQALQQQHFARLKKTGTHFDSCSDQLDLARKAVESIERYGFRPSAPKLNLAALETARPEASSITSAIATALRSSAKKARPEYDPAGIAAFLAAIDTAALQRELDRRAALQVVHEHREMLRAQADTEPTRETLYELALAELALAHYLEAMQVAERLANEELALMQGEPERAEHHREQAMNSLMLLHESAQLAGRRNDAIAALERAGSLVDIEKEPILWAELYEPLALYLVELALYDRAEPLVEKITDIREELQGEGDPALAESLILWYHLLDARAQYAGARSVAARAARLISNEGPTSLKRLATALSCQATAAWRLGNYSEAEPLIRRVLAINERLFGTEHPELTFDLNGLALVLLDTNRSSEAESLLRRALEIDERTYGPNHPDVARDLNHLVLTLMDTGRMNEAEPIMRRVLAIDEMSFGSDHPTTATALHNLARLLSKTDRLTEAEPMARRALAIDEQSYGPNHPSVARDLNLLGLLLGHGERIAEAEQLLRRSIRIDEQMYGESNSNLAAPLYNLAQLLQRSNQLAEAQALATRLVIMMLEFAQESGHQNPHLQDAVTTYLQLLRDSGLSPEQAFVELNSLSEPYGLRFGRSS